jgi:hypothetical protein
LRRSNEAAFRGKVESIALGAFVGSYEVGLYTLNQVDP